MNILKSISLSILFLMCRLTLFIILGSKTRKQKAKDNRLFTQQTTDFLTKVILYLLSLMLHSSFPPYDDILVLVKCVTNTCYSSDRVHSACHLNIEILTPRNITSNVSPETLKFPITSNILS